MGGRATIRRLALARAISGSGTTAAYVALSYVVYRDTHSAAWVSVAIMATFGVAGLTAPVSGWIGDRYDRRRVMIVSDLCAAALSVGVAAASGTTWLMVALTLAVSLAEAPFFPASSAAVPNLVDDEDLAWANGLLAASRSVGRAGRAGARRRDRGHARGGRGVPLQRRLVPGQRGPGGDGARPLQRRPARPRVA